MAFSWKEIKENYKNVDEIYARFKEVILTEGIPVDTLKGEVFVKRPDFLKMLVQYPETQIIYSTMDSTLIFLPSWNQIQLLKTPRFVADFFLLDIEKYTDSIQEIVLNDIKKWRFFLKKGLKIPYDKIELDMDKTTRNLKILSLYEKDVELRFLFEDFRKNPGFNKEVFDIKFPKNVQRIIVDSLTSK